MGIARLDSDASPCACPAGPVYGREARRGCRAARLPPLCQQLLHSEDSNTRLASDLTPNRARNNTAVSVADYIHVELTEHNNKLSSYINNRFTGVVNHRIEIDGVGTERETGAQTAEQVRLEPGPGGRTVRLELATSARPELLRFTPLLTRQLSDTVGVRQKGRDVTYPVLQATLQYTLVIHVADNT